MSDGLKYSVRVQDNSKLAIDELEKSTERALYAIGVKAVEGSVNAISGRYSIASAVDTGRLRASISFITPESAGGSGMTKPPNAQAGDELYGKADKNTVVVGSNVEYAAYVHAGTSRMAGRPFLREGIDRKKEEMQDQVDKIFKGQL